MQSLKNEDLKKLILTSSIVVLWQSVKLDKVIGCGSAGEVYLGSYNSKQAAVKKVKSLQQNPSAFKEFEREVVTLIRIGQHPNLVSLLGITKQGEDFYLLMDYC
jgi:serine/threonine protein kinase